MQHRIWQIQALSPKWDVKSSQGQSKSQASHSSFIIMKIIKNQQSIDCAVQYTAVLQAA